MATLRASWLVPLIAIVGCADLSGSEPGGQVRAAGAASLTAPAPTDFGGVPVGQRSMPSEIRLVNTETVPVTVTAVTTTAPFDIAAVPTLPVTLPSGAGLAVTVTFAPTGPGPASGQLTFVSDAPDSPTVAALDGFGLAPGLTIDAPLVDFGFQRVGTSNRRIALAANTGTTALTISAITAPAPFTVLAPTGPLRLLPNESVSVEIEFAPTAPGAVTAVVTLSHDAAGSPTSIDLAGVGTVPGLTPRTILVDLGKVFLGATSPAGSLELVNTGDVPYVISAVTAPAPFAVTGPTLPRSVLPGAEVAFVVTFAPSATGPTTGALMITSTAPNAPRVTLSGEGSSAVPITVEPRDLGFGGVGVDTISAPQRLTLRNATSEPVFITSVMATPPFTRASMTLPALVLPDAILSINVMLAPIAAGPVTGTLVIVTDVGTVPAGLSGAGVTDEPPADGGCATGGPAPAGGLGLAALALLGLRRHRSRASCRRGRRTHR